MSTQVPEKSEAQGGKGGNQWDDGTEHEGVTKIDIAAGGQGIQQIKFGYVKNGETKEGPFHGVKGRNIVSTIVINHPDEYLISVEGWYDSSNIIQGIKFQTNKNISQFFGYEFSGDGTPFSLQVKDKKIISFHGSSSSHLNSLGAYFAPISSSTVTPPNSVTKIYISTGNGGIEQIKFEDVENGETKEIPFHGVKGKNLISTVVISNHPDHEFLIFVESWYDSSNVFQGIKFKPEKNSSDFFGYKLSEDDGTPFSLQVKNKKIIGVHRFANSNLTSPGTYFVLNRCSSPNKVEAQGGNGGTTFDDGSFDHVRKVYIGQGDSGVAYVKFEYEKDGNIETREHGKKTLLGTEEFEVDPDDYITSMEVSLDNVFGFNSEIVTAIVFKTFKGKISQPFGMVTENKFDLKDGNGGKLAGFHGKASDVLYALGAYFTPTTTITTSSIPLTPSHAKATSKRLSSHPRRWSRKKTLLDPETFELDYPSEYITSVEGYYDKVFGVEAEVVTSLTFKTNKKTSQPFGMSGGEFFELKEDGYKIVGFHGKAGDLVHQIGVHVVPIFTNRLLVL
ncbi:unnamed protein product [Arabis nemorensis]|uniref:Jacalin-type lectin domain-containing protein n=1 Tax=Arabis nemorensis TaxID=586526 RepID=A0A565BFV1_9BRAS|nr:unnamed protein product [Arabis nemorensis]